ncbi:MSHA biogenesis protein MshI [Vibrio brasiliensis]
MNIQSLISKFKRSKETAKRLSVVVQPSALYFSSLPGVELALSVPYQGSTWHETLLDALRDANVSEVVLDVVLDSNLYQTYQIEKPSVPENELAGALPFLLKDLVSERVTDIVADAVALPNSNKLQVYVFSRSAVVNLYHGLKSLNIELSRIMVEDEVWGHASENKNFLLLQRSRQSQFRVSAFVESQCAFQRTIRGIASPLTGVASSILQLDGIALELQRSIDYLSSQLRTVSLHQMYICCDDEEQQQIVDALNDTLSVKVSQLSELGQQSGEILVGIVQNFQNAQINLFPEEFKTKQDYFTLRNVVLIWGVLSAFLLLSSAALVYQKTQLTQELQLYRSQVAEFEKQTAVLNQRLSQHKPTPAKVAAVARLKLEIEAKRNSLKAVSEFDETQQVGYSGVMRSLAALGRNDISLSEISIDAVTLDLVGLARNPQAIPNWVNQFKSELDLVGRTFEKLKIGRNEQGIITFELKTTQESE